MVFHGDVKVTAAMIEVVTKTAVSPTLHLTRNDPGMESIIAQPSTLLPNGLPELSIQIQTQHVHAKQ
jgi:hypothetical protein